MKLITITGALALLTLSASPVHLLRFSFGPELYHRSYRAPPTAGLEGSDMAFMFVNTDNHDATDPTTVAQRFVSEKLTSSGFYIHSSYTDQQTEITHVYFKQLIDGIEVANADINVNVDATGRIISWGDSFYKGREAAIDAREQQIDKASQILAAEGRLGDRIDYDKDIPSQDQDKKVESTFTDKLEAVVETVADVFTEKLSQIVLGGKSKEKVSSTEAKHAGCGHTNRPSKIEYEINYPDAPISPIEALGSVATYISASGLSVTGAGDATIVPVNSFAPGPSSPIATLENVPFAISPIPVRSVLVQDDNGELRFSWDLQIEMQDNWFHALVDASTGELLSLFDWVSDASYNVYPLGLNDPSDGPPELLVDPYDKIASPLGWHRYPSGPVRNFTTTISNNVFAHENTDGRDAWRDNYRPDGGKKLLFDFPLEPETMEPKEYLDGAIVNLFYWNNIAHDIFYRYGFDEASGNFQQHNFGRKGRDGDAVIANAQDGSGYNNANFATPPDGQNGKMRMYIWDATSPMRDGDLEAGIIVHEYAHGVSTRLTGGPANSDCLLWGESGGMGEGWGDFFATIFRMQNTTTRYQDFGMGNWANGGEGIRRYKYSTNNITNPETFGTLNKRFEVHGIGAVWAEILFEVYWNLVDKHGFTTQWFPPAPTAVDDEFDPMNDGDRKKKRNAALKHITKYGNTLSLQLVIEGMKLQPCRPSFINARDAILQADEIFTDGKNKCDIWKGFAKRGLGVDARTEFFIRRESFKIPAGC